MNARPAAVLLRLPWTVFETPSHRHTRTHVHSVLFCVVAAEDAVQALSASTARMHITKVFCVLNFCLWFF